MSSEPTALRVEGLSKCYTLYDRPDDRLKQSIVPRLQRLAGRTPTQYYREFWALRDVSFEVRRGETVGIIGRNGSGKSTLLQIICGTLHPTAGSVESSGRIAALLELGSGFNPEFTGRENVYMNGALLGLTREQIDARFDKIAAFADIGTFIDQPLKHYSSGMGVRLAFSVIAHVDADILVIDEALAVGDAFFVQKCMRFLRRFMDHGTVLFVSHDTGAVVNLCQRAVWLQDGCVKSMGAPRVLADAYFQSELQNAYGTEYILQPAGSATDSETTLPVANAATAPQEADPSPAVNIFDNSGTSSGWRTGEAEIVALKFLNGAGDPVSNIQGGESVTLVIRARAKSDMFSPIIGFFVKDRLGQALFGENTFSYVSAPLTLSAGQAFEARFSFDMPILPTGDYTMAASLAEGSPNEHVQHHWLHEAMIFRVTSDRIRLGLVGIPFRSVDMQIAPLNP